MCVCVWLSCNKHIFREEKLFPSRQLSSCQDSGSKLLALNALCAVLCVQWAETKCLAFPEMTTQPFVRAVCGVPDTCKSPVWGRTPEEGPRTRGSESGTTVGRGTEWKKCKRTFLSYSTGDTSFKVGAHKHVFITVNGGKLMLIYSTSIPCNLLEK